MRSYSKYIRRAKALGARGAKVIPAKSIVAAEWVRIKCQFGCDGYGGCLTCPPTPQSTVVSHSDPARFFSRDRCKLKRYQTPLMK